MDLLVTSTVAYIACFYDTVLMLPWIYSIHAYMYVLSYASANCMLAYMLLHRGICTFGALLVTVIQELENPFEEMSQDMLVLDTKEIASQSVVKTVNTAEQIGQEQFNVFVKECLVDRTKPIHDTIHRNKLVLFNTAESKATKGKQQLSSMKCDVELFSRLYIACQTRDGNLEEFFRHENQACPPSLSVGGRLHLGTKSDMLVCLENYSKSQPEAPKITSIIIDGAAIVQMLKPGGVETSLVPRLSI